MYVETLQNIVSLDIIIRVKTTCNLHTFAQGTKNATLSFLF